MPKSLKPIAAIALALGATLASAAPVSTVVDFNSLNGGTFGKSIGTTYSEDGYKLTAAAKGGLFATSNFVDAEGKKGETLTSYALTFASASGSTFDLESLDLADLLNIGVSSKVLLSYTTAGSSKAVNEYLTIDKKPGLQTFTLDLSDLTSFSLTDAFGYQVDNITVSPYQAPTPAVPEPGSLALMFAGLGLLGTIARRRPL